VIGWYPALEEKRVRSIDALYRDYQMVKIVRGIQRMYGNIHDARLDNIQFQVAIELATSREADGASRD
jgi:hypothetical protein